MISFKMLPVQGKVLVLLFVALMLANAQCFTDCLVAHCGSKPMPCHETGKTKADHCAHGHDLTAPSQHFDTPVALAPASALPVLDSRPLAVETGSPLTPQIPDLSPPAQLRI
jgi:hypothetical protein